MPPEPPSLDLVLKRNSIERLKREKHPLDIVNELDDIIERGYENISEEDVVRFMWYGLYHDKPKVGYFMMRIKIPSGLLTPAQLRVILQFREQGANPLPRRQLDVRRGRQLFQPRLAAQLQSAGVDTLKPG